MRNDARFDYERPVSRFNRQGPAGRTDLGSVTLSLAMSNYGVNKSFVLRGIEDVIFEERPVPESTLVT
jgi:hypothetical protein